MDGGRPPHDKNRACKDNNNRNNVHKQSSKGTTNRKRRHRDDDDDIVIIPTDYYCSVPMHVLFNGSRTPSGPAGGNIFSPLGPQLPTVPNMQNVPIARTPPPLIRPTPVYGVPAMFGEPSCSNLKCTLPRSAFCDRRKSRYIGHNICSAFSSPGSSRDSPPMQRDLQPAEHDEHDEQPTANWSTEAIRYASNVVFIKSLLMLLSQLNTEEENCEKAKNKKN
uniref:Uncharacterized protein n=1 Tax=Steinernema glaseri TaxID=37863 RepID=A0A1I8AIF0_9BILA